MFIELTGIRDNKIIVNCDWIADVYVSTLGPTVVTLAIVTDNRQETLHVTESIKDIKEILGFKIDNVWSTC